MSEQLVGVSQKPSYPASLLRPFVLLLLHEAPGYGYQLPQRLSELAGSTWDHGTVYRLLNTLENEGLVTSTWERSVAGPQRRRYTLTSEGRRLLVECASSLAGLHQVLERFLARVEPHLGRTLPGGSEEEATAAGRNGGEGAAYVTAVAGVAGQQAGPRS